MNENTGPLFVGFVNRHALTSGGGFSRPSLTFGHSRHAPPPPSADRGGERPPPRDFDRAYDRPPPRDGESQPPRPPPSRFSHPQPPVPANRRETRILERQDGLVRC
eukprot:1196318-Prorocentrum_minimum.AAC.5